VAVQVVTKAHGKILELDHVGSAHIDAELALLLRAARERLHRGRANSISAQCRRPRSPSTRWRTGHGDRVKKLVNTLRTVRSATIHLSGELISLDPAIPPPAPELLTALDTKVTKTSGTTQVAVLVLAVVLSLLSWLGLGRGAAKIYRDVRRDVSRAYR